jgi:hypothetical protein
VLKAKKHIAVAWREATQVGAKKGEWEHRHWRIGVFATRSSQEKVMVDRNDFLSYMFVIDSTPS